MSNKDHTLPTEILLVLGELLDKKSLYTCLQVSRHWQLTLYPAAWTTITKKQWCDPTFPIQASTKLFPPFNAKEEETIAEKLLYCLQKIRSLEWSDNEAPRRPRNWRDSVPNPLAYSPLPLLPVLTMGLPQLTHLSLIVGNNTIPSSELLPFLTPANFPKLQSIVLDLPASCWGSSHVKEIYSLLSKLQEVDIRGAWYYTPEKNTNEGDWKLTSLTLECIWAPLLKKCVALESLTMPHTRKAGGEPDRGTRLRLVTVAQTLQTMPGLKKIAYEGAGNDADDVFEIQGPAPNGVTDTAVWKMTAGERDGEMFTLQEVVNLSRE
ncbi:MAG: hypothetical protein JOS17DRAFT_794458 [Linnemannia elongata]|nr:MAG: hypothetical protein JOS17DRAFT_794458 [Linnemannia elongata]